MIEEPNKTDESQPSRQGNKRDKSTKTAQSGDSGRSDGSKKRSRNRRRRRKKSAWSVDQFQVPEKPGETRFHDLDLPDEIMHAIADQGFEYCTPIQIKTLSHVAAGQNVAGRAQTGTGKTAAFLISIFTNFLRNPVKNKRPRGTPRALVLAPTRELVIQIIKDADEIGKYCDFNCIAVYGGLDLNKQRAKLEKRNVDLIAATPGRLLDFVKRGKIDLGSVEVLIIDEADRMLDMGFIPDVKRIIRKTPHKNKRRTMLFSATLTDDVLRLASQWMPDPVICEIAPEQVAVDTVDQIVYITDTREKFKLLYNILKKRNNARTLIFCNRRDHTLRLASKLRRHGIQCEMLSGAVPQKKRLRILEGFRDGSIKVVVATDVAGRGLHVEDIGLVVNYEFPYEPEDYVHRIGRTGRAGEEGTAISFACEEESFVIPEIEEYIGNPLKCSMPDEELLRPVEKPNGDKSRSRRRRKTRPSGGNPRTSNPKKKP